MNIKETVRKNPVLAILRNLPLDRTIDYVQAAIDGGIRFFEVALNSKEAIKQISMLRERFGDHALVGAGTAITPALADAAIDAGAQFLLAPSSTIEMLAYCQRRNVPFMPGVLTPTDVDNCLHYGFDTLKLFPAGDLPVNYVKSLRGPFDSTEYVAIGGVNADNIASFFKAGYLGVGLASNLMDRSIIASGEWEKGVEQVRNLISRIPSRP